MAIADINAAGGIKSMGGAALEAVLGDSQTKPEIGAAEVEKMNEAGVHAIQGCYQSAVGLAASAAARNIICRSRLMLVFWINWFSAAEQRL